MTKIKMCGLRREEDIEYVNILKPDYIGYIFDKTRKRYVSPEAAAALTKKLDEKIISVGVFVNAPVEFIISIVRSETIRAVQLHGDESEETIARLQNEGIFVIKAFKIRTEDDISKAETSCADMVLLDSGCGTGEVFDWSLIKNISREYFLAGGLTAENVGQAAEALQPYAVDASSCLETNGVKDYEKMKAFLTAVRSKK